MPNLLQIGHSLGLCTRAEQNSRPKNMICKCNLFQSIFGNVLRNLFQLSNISKMNNQRIEMRPLFDFKNSLQRSLAVNVCCQTINGFGRKTNHAVVIENRDCLGNIFGNNSHLYADNL